MAIKVRFYIRKRDVSYFDCNLFTITNRNIKVKQKNGISVMYCITVSFDLRLKRLNDQIFGYTPLFSPSRFCSDKVCVNWAIFVKYLVGFKERALRDRRFNNV